MFDLDKIKAVDIQRVAQDLGLQVRNKAAKCIRPQNHKHGDRNPSLTFDTESNRYRCWVCPDNRGSVIDLVMNVREIDFNEAVKWLGETYQLVPSDAIPESSSEGKAKLILSTGASLEPSGDATPKWPEGLHTAIYTAFMKALGPISDAGREYLNSRGIRDETIESHLITSGENCNSAIKALKVHWTFGEVKASGIYAFYPFLKNSIPFVVFPFFHDYKVQYLQVRRMDSNEHPKFLMPSTGSANLLPEIPCLYNVDVLKGLPEASDVYVAEAVIDCLTLEQEGGIAVAAIGTQGFKEEWVSQFKGFNVYSAYDNDSAGRKGTEKLARVFRKIGIEVKYLSLPEGHDINSHFYPKGD